MARHIWLHSGAVTSKFYSSLNSSCFPFGQSKYTKYLARTYKCMAKSTQVNVLEQDDTGEASPLQALHFKLAGQTPGR